MRMKTKKKLTVLFSAAFAAMFAATGLTALGNLGATADGEDDPAPAATEAQALYYVDAGRLGTGQDGTGDISYRTSTGGNGYPSAVESPFMTAYGLTFGTSASAGLYNSVTDKPYVYSSAENSSNLWSSVEAGSHADPKTGKNWGFTFTKHDTETGSDVDVAYGWRVWRIVKSVSEVKGYETTRVVSESDDGVLTYIFEVDNDTTPLHLQVGSSKGSGWNNTEFYATVNGGSQQKFTVNDNATVNREWDNIKGVKKADNKYYVTVEFFNRTDSVSVSHILLTTQNYQLVRNNVKTSYVKGATDGVVNLAPSVDTTNQDVNFDSYVKGTIDQTTIDAINAADDWQYVDAVVTVSTKQKVNAKILALPSNTAYFVDGGNEAKYNETDGYGYTGVTGDRKNMRGWIDEDYDTSRRYTDKYSDEAVSVSADIYYQFDNLPAGTYGVKVGANDPWEPRTMKISLNGTEASNKLNAVQNSVTSATNYITLSAEGNLTVGVLKDDKQPVFTYIQIFEAETITFSGGAQSGATVPDPVHFDPKEGIELPESLVGVCAGYEFMGWYTAATDGVKVEPGTNAMESMTLYAQWQDATPRTVIFKYNDGTTADKTVENVVNGTVLTGDDLPGTPTREGYLFGGWQIEGTENTFKPATDAVTSDLTLNAIWVEDPLAAETGYTVGKNKVNENGTIEMTYVGNWSDGAVDGGKQIYLVDGKTTVATLVANGGNNQDKGLVLSLVSKNGCRINFTGTRTYWFHSGGGYGNHVNTSGEYAGLQVAFNFSPSYTELRDLYSRDILQVGKATLNNGVITYVVETYAADDTNYTKLLGKVEFTITILDFTGEEYPVNFVYDPCGSTLGGASVKYYTLNSTYFTFTFDENNGTGATPASYEVRGGTSYSFGNTPRAGYRFLGWKSDDASDSTLYGVGSNMTTTVTKSLNFTAQWVQTFTVSFDLNGAEGTAPETQTVDTGTKVVAPAAPERAGYKFKGWYKADNTVFNFDTMTITEDITLQAKWAELFTVTFDVNGGTGTVASQTVADGEKAKAPKDTVIDTLTKEGYEFKGWQTRTGEEGSYEYTDFDFDTMTITEATTLYAKWEAIKYTVTFDSNGGSEVAEAKVDYNTAATKPADPTKAGFTFDKWYKDAECTTEFNFDTEVITEDITLYAKWTANAYVVTFDSKGGSAVANVNANGGEKIAAPAAPTQEGYKFKGWYKESACENAFDFENDTITADITLYAKWAELFTVTFDANGGTGTVASQIVADGEKATEPNAEAIAALSKADHAFKGWYKESTCENAVDFDEYTVTGNTTLYAKWAQLFTVTFDANGGEGTVAAQQVANGDKVGLLSGVFTKQHYDLAGWTKDAAGNVAFDIANDTISENTTLYAVWTPKKYTVTFDTNGGNTIEAAQVEYNTAATEPAAPVKYGYTFEGWFTDNGTFESAYNFATLISADITVYAKWAVVTYAVAFEANGGSTVDSQQIEHNTTATKPADPTKEGYAFKGWFTDNDTFANAFDFATPITAATTLYAKWAQLFTVTFEANGGSAVAEVKVASGDALTKPAAPAKDGYAFAGWFKNDELTIAYDFVNEVVTEDITLWAKWAKSFTVTFNTNGGSTVAAVTVIDGEKLSAPADPTKEGFVFAGWFTDEALQVKYSFDAAVVDNLTLYASWEEAKEEKKGGCGSAISASFAVGGAAVMLAIGGAAVMLAKKKKSDK